MAQDLTRTPVGTHQTNLIPTITVIPQTKGFGYGVGIDVITGSLAVFALEPFPVTSAAEKSESSARLLYLAPERPEHGGSMRLRKAAPSDVHTSE